MFKNQKGFTLIELLIVIAVLAALAAVVVPAVAAFMRASTLTAANTEVQNIKTGAMSYLADIGEFPDNSDELYDGSGINEDYISGYTVYGDYTFVDDSGQIETAIAKDDYGDIMEFNVDSQLWEKK